jgi:hypothetical protein
VRAVKSATVYEIGKRQYQPIIQARPDLVDELAAIMRKNMQNIHQQREAYANEDASIAIRERIWRFFFGN